MRSPGEADALGLLGLARRAGAVVVGVDATRRALRQDQVALVLLARDAADGQMQKVGGILRHRDIPVRWISSKEALGGAVGEPRLTVLGVTKKAFAEQLLNRLPGDARRGPREG